MKIGFDVDNVLVDQSSYQLKYGISYFQKKGHKIVIVTGRAHTTENGITGKLFRWMLVHWLKKN